MKQLAQMRAVARRFCGASAALPSGPQAEADRYDRGWLCPTKADRVRLTDTSPAVRRALLLAGLFGGVGVLVMVPWIGWGPVAVFALVPGPLVALDRLLARARFGNLASR
jgi:hypothetical protein